VDAVDAVPPGDVGGDAGEVRAHGRDAGDTYAYSYACEFSHVKRVPVLPTITQSGWSSSMWRGDPGALGRRSAQ
jgi:hypothetical protein